GRHRRSLAPRGAADGRRGARQLSGVGGADASRRMTGAATTSASRSHALSRAGRLLPALGVGAVWFFLLLFLVYPVLRILYDAFSDEAGRLTLANFAELARDRCYLRSLVNSLLLGLGTVAATSLVGFAVAFLLVRYDFVGRNLFGYLTLIPIISPPLVGARGFTKLVRITLPLTTPGYVAGALLVFIWTFSDFATPLVLGVHDLLASQAYLNIVQFVDRRLFRMGIVISALMVVLAVVFLVAARRYVAIKDYSSLSYSKVARRRLSPLGQTGAITFLSALMLLSFIPYLGVFFASVGKGWSLTPFPVRYTLAYFERVIVETPNYIVNSFLYS